jgi:hypothetical protein
MYPIYLLSGAGEIDPTIKKNLVIFSCKNVHLCNLSMRDSATSAMRGWEHWKPDGFASELFLDQLILLES